MLELKNIKKVYKSKKGVEVTALKNINIKLENSGMIFIVGKSGSGKSTLLNLIGGLDSQTEGEILINGKSLTDFKNNEYDSYRNTYIGFIFQEFNVLEQYNVYENIMLAVKLQNKIKSKEEIDKLLKELGIENLGNRKINELSGGQKQRVAIARALIKNPEIILADEPTGNLDQTSSTQIFDILKNISKEKLVIVVSHDMESATKYADRIIEIKDGDVINDTKKTENIENKSFKLTKSKLPFTYALKMALTSFKSKPFKLVMTIILTAMSLIFTGIAVNSFLFDKTVLVTNTMQDNNNYIYDVDLENCESFFQGCRQLSLNDENIKEIEQLTKSKLNIQYRLFDNFEPLRFELGEIDDKSEFYDRGMMLGVNIVEVVDDRILNNIIGSIPSNANEIVIHKFLADNIIKSGIKLINDELYFPKDYNDLINSKKEIKLGQNKVIITGIVNDDDSLYKKAKETGYFEPAELRQYFYNNYSDKGSTIYVKGFIKNAVFSNSKEEILKKMYFKGVNNLSDKYYTPNNLKELNSNIKVIMQDGIKDINTLNKNEVIISVDLLRELNKTFDTKFNNYLKESNKTYDEVKCTP